MSFLKVSPGSFSHFWLFFIVLVLHINMGTLPAHMTIPGGAVCADPALSCCVCLRTVSCCFVHSHEPGGGLKELPKLRAGWCSSRESLPILARCSRHTDPGSFPACCFEVLSESNSGPNPPEEQSVATNSLSLLALGGGPFLPCWYRCSFQRLL